MGEKITPQIKANKKDLERAKEFIALPEAQDLFRKLHESRKGRRTTIGLVTEVRRRDGNTEVCYRDLNGLYLSFNFDARDPAFSKAPSGGFRVGDLVVNTFRKGLEMESVQLGDFTSDFQKRLFNRFQGLK